MDRTLGGPISSLGINRDDEWMDLSDEDDDDDDLVGRPRRRTCAVQLAICKDTLVSSFKELLPRWQCVNNLSCATDDQVLPSMSIHDYR